jgi:hypothetical protein
MISFSPWTSLATTGRPASIASTATFPNGSHLEGTSAMSASARAHHTESWMPAKLIAGEPAAIRRSFSSNHSYPGKTPPTRVKLTGKPCSRRRSVASIATSVPFRGERRLTTTSLPGRSALRGTTSAGPTMPLYTTWTRSPRRRPAFARASRLAWLFATMLPANRSGRARSHASERLTPSSASCTWQIAGVRAIRAAINQIGIVTVLT